MKSILDLLRVKHWIKNSFILVPAFFAGNLFDSSQLRILFSGLLAFSLVASGVYIINDSRDRNIDRIHPQKKYRPIAAGKVSVTKALSISAFILTIGLGLAWTLSPNFFYLLLTYFILNLAYSVGLKNVPILDLFIVASGFLLRVHSGGILVDVFISHWLYIMTFLLALFLVIAKRHDDLVLYGETGEEMRKVSKAYNLEFINSCLTLLSAVILVAYIMYTVSPEVLSRFKSDYLFTTTVFVMAGIMRYLQITFVEKKSGSPTDIFLKDKFIVITVLGWVISFYFLIYK